MKTLINKSETHSGMMTEERKSSPGVILGRARAGCWGWWCWKSCWNGGAEDGPPARALDCLGLLRASDFLL